MPQQEIPSGTTSPLTIGAYGPASDYYWGIFTPSFDPLGLWNNPNGWNVTQTADPDVFLVTVPASQAPAINLYIQCTDNPPTTGHSANFTVIAPPPPPPTNGWNRRQINLPFRRRRPSPNVQP